MIDFTSTNVKIAELLQQQTYAERMEMAEWFRDALNDQKADMDLDVGFEASDIASLFSIWAEAETEEAETP